MKNVRYYTITMREVFMTPEGIPAKRVTDIIPCSNRQDAERFLQSPDIKIMEFLSQNTVEFMVDEKRTMIHLRQWLDFCFQQNVISLN
jgi:hypothetical protein